MNSEELHKAMLDMRGVEVPCKHCGGHGVRAYGSTSTWRGGIGGQTITSGPCDKCWGSGEEDMPWPSHRLMEQMRRDLEECRNAMLAADADVKDWREMFAYALQRARDLVTKAGAGK